MISNTSHRVLTVGRDNFQREVLESDVPVLVDFYADWCPPCRAIAPVIESLAGEFAGRAKIAKLDTDHDGELSSFFGINSIPSVLLFKDGEPVKRLVGLRSRDDYVRALQSSLG